MPYICRDMCEGGMNCGSDRFWRVIRDGRAAIPFLLDMLDDSRPTQVTLHHVGGVYAVGDIALIALKEIAPDLPYVRLTGVSIQNGISAFWNFLHASAGNRRLLKKRVKGWFEQHDRDFAWEPGNSFHVMDCVSHCSHPAGGHLILKATSEQQ